MYRALNPPTSVIIVQRRIGSTSRFLHDVVYSASNLALRLAIHEKQRKARQSAVGHGKLPAEYRGHREQCDGRKYRALNPALHAKDLAH